MTYLVLYPSVPSQRDVFGCDGRYRRWSLREAISHRLSFASQVAVVRRAPFDVCVPMVHDTCSPSTPPLACLNSLARLISTCIFIEMRTNERSDEWMNGEMNETFAGAFSDHFACCSIISLSFTTLRLDTAWSMDHQMKAVGKPTTENVAFVNKICFVCVYECARWVYDVQCTV